jgi:putative endonuclease
MHADEQRLPTDRPPPSAPTTAEGAPAAQRSPAAGRSPGELGRLGEDLACQHLQRLGFRVLERNVRTRGGEIDVIAFDGRTLVFAEVKTRRARGARPFEEGSTPLSRLGPAQRAALRRQAVAWLCDPDRERPSARAVRLDAIGVTVDERGSLLRLEHLEAAW